MHEIAFNGRLTPVIDVFAGPGGLGEGFASFSTQSGDYPFDVRLSIEKDAIAHRTLLLRSFYRQFTPHTVPEAYYDFLRSPHLDEEEKFSNISEEYPIEITKARYQAWHAELGDVDQQDVRLRIDEAVEGKFNWVLIGGPPCQAYSLAGRSRNTGKQNYTPEDDKRQTLYVEYLQILADHAPAVFIMENVKGLISATLENRKIFERIINDLRDPIRALHREGRSNRIMSKPGAVPSPKYHLFPLVKPDAPEDPNLSDYVVRMEYYGVPQTRHRVIILGVREDLGPVDPKGLKPQEQVPANIALAGLPELRSGLSREDDSPSMWRRRLLEIEKRVWYQSLSGDYLYKTMADYLMQIKESEFEYGRGTEFIPYVVTIKDGRYIDDRLGGVCNHSTRAHMPSDLHRYFFASCFALAEKHSPQLKHFPKNLLPNHVNVDDAMDGSLFSDRFRVQLLNKPSTTVTSHIAKDGHYYIHPDPAQCRSLTVREAARLQTFPDNYFLCGSRTAQYIQVGNAVPPLIAYQLAGIVYDLLARTGAIE